MMSFSPRCKCRPMQLLQAGIRRFTPSICQRRPAISTKLHVSSYLKQCEGSTLNKHTLKKIPVSHRLCFSCSTSSSVNSSRNNYILPGCYRSISEVQLEDVCLLSSPTIGLCCLFVTFYSCLPYSHIFMVFMSSFGFSVFAQVFCSRLYVFLLAFLRISTVSSVFRSGKY